MKRNRTKRRGETPNVLPAAKKEHRSQEYPGPAPGYSWSFFFLACVVALPVLITRGHWLNLWRYARPRAWDGTGHYALSYIYDQSIFPDTFGWTNAYFAGMPFPNFYPPLFHWLVALLHHTGLLSFSSAFKLVLVTPVILIPAAIALLAFKLSGRDRIVALASAFVSTVLLVDHRFVTPYPPGLDYFSTFQIGLYVQPLGFVLLLAWFVSYLGAHQSAARFALSALLLALTVLANFFNAMTAVVLIASTVTIDLIKHYGAGGASRRIFAAHVGSPVVAACLTAFWVVPMLSQYGYFVTRPNILPLGAFIPRAMLLLYAAAAVGFILWSRRATAALWPFLVTCVWLGVAVLLAPSFAPGWFPFQSARFVSTLNFLLTVPAGYALARLFSGGVVWLDRLTRGARAAHARAGVLAAGAALVLLACAAVLIKPAVYGLAYYPTDERERIDLVLRFAREHVDGRYLVEVPHISYPAAQLDGRALNSYLGTQGNEAVSVVFREASPNAVFFNPLVNVYSASPDSFGFSSVLADDLDFTSQPLSRHLERARQIGVRYLVIISPWIKDRLSKESGVSQQYDFGAWSVFELGGTVPARVRVLAYKPALVVSTTSFKARRRDEYSFVRLAEEQFADGWFDVLLARAPTSGIDELPDTDRFGALIVDTYEYGDEERAYQRLRDIDRRGRVILLSSADPLFLRVKASLGDFANTTIIEREEHASGSWLSSEQPTFRYNSSPIRGVWRQIRAELEAHKVPGGPEPAPRVVSSVTNDRIDVAVEGDAPEVPLIVETTYHPSWQRSDGQAVYAVTPFFMLTFVRQPAQLTYARRWFDRVALLTSGGTLVLLTGFTIWFGRGRRRHHDAPVDREAKPTRP